jgi:hypothetical protein
MEHRFYRSSNLGITQIEADFVVLPRGGMGKGSLRKISDSMFGQGLLDHREHISAEAIHMGNALPQLTERCHNDSGSLQLGNEIVYFNASGSL